MNEPARGDPTARAVADDGWQARLWLGFAPRARRTRLTRQLQRGPLRVQRGFYPEGAVCHLYVLHPPGGMVGGDGLDIAVDVEPGAHVLVTMPGAAKCYRSAGPTTRQRTRLRVAHDAVLEWLPPELILFDGARLTSRLDVILSGGARFIGWDLTCWGRPASGERFVRGAADCWLGLERDGRPLLRDRLRLDQDRGMDAPTALRGFAVTATFVATGAAAADLAAARASLGADPVMPISLTLLDDLLIARLLTAGSEPALIALRRLWACLRPRLLGRAASAPRIWAT